MTSGIGATGIILIVLVALLLFGPSKLPELGKAFGRTLREFKNATKGMIGDEEADRKDVAPHQDAQRIEPQRQEAVPAAQANPTAQTAQTVPAAQADQAAPIAQTVQAAQTAQTPEHTHGTTTDKRLPE